MRFLGYLRNLLTILSIGILLLMSVAVLAHADSTASSTITPSQQWQEALPTPILGHNDSILTNSFPDRQWWMQFHDTTLNNYIDEAVKNNPTIHIAVIRIDEARAIVGQYRSQQLPTLSFAPTYTRIGIPGGLANGIPLPSVLKILELPFQASYEVDLFGKYRDATKAAKKQLAATEASARAGQIGIEGEVAAAYINLLRADALVVSQDQDSKLLLRIYQLKQNQNQLGLVSFDEVIRADRDVAQAQTNFTLYRQQQALAAHALSVLLGRTPKASTELPRGTLDTITLPSQTNAGIPTTLITRRPDILAQEEKLAQQKLNVTVARKAFLPTINLGVTAGTAGTGVNNAFNTNNFFDMETLSGTQPIFQGGRLVNTVRLNKAQLREQLENYHQTILNALKEVEDNIALLRTDYENLDSNASRITLTQQNLKLTQNLYQQGLSPHLDVLQAQSELTQYQQLGIQSKGDAAIATINLYKALGGGF